MPRQKPSIDHRVVVAINILNRSEHDHQDDYGPWNFASAQDLGGWPPEEYGRAAERLTSSERLSLPEDTVSDTSVFLVSIVGHGCDEQFVLACAVLLARPKKFFTRKLPNDMEKATAADMIWPRVQKMRPNVFSEASQLAGEYLSLPGFKGLLPNKRFDGYLLMLPDMLNVFNDYVGVAGMSRKFRSRRHSSRSLVLRMLVIHIEKHTGKISWNDLADLIGVFGEEQGQEALERVFGRTQSLFSSDSPSPT